jgi:hypothetical protein
MQAAADTGQHITQEAKASEPSVATAPNGLRSSGVEIGCPPLCLPIFNSLSSAGKP